MYFVFMHQTYNDGSKPVPAVYTFDNYNDAISAFHSRLAASMSNDKVSHAVAMVIDFDGKALRSETYRKE